MYTHACSSRRLTAIKANFVFTCTLQFMKCENSMQKLFNLLEYVYTFNINDLLFSYLIKLQMVFFSFNDTKEVNQYPVSSIGSNIS